jgi:predicted RND superfamily exporter protein
LLVGTIIFVLLYLPHCVKSDAKTSEETLIFGRFADIKFEKNRWIVGAIIVLTLVFGWFAPGVQFDTNMSNLNYMSDQHRLDARYFQNLSTDIDSLKSISETFLFSSGKSYDEALENDLDCQAALREAGVQSKYATFIRPKTEQEASLSRWKSFVEKYNSKYKDTVEEYAIKAGFQPSALTRFHAKMDADYEVQSAEYFMPMMQTLFAANFYQDTQSGDYYVVNKVVLSDDKISSLPAALNGRHFSMQKLNNVMAERMSDDFNYIGFACSAIVFLFLWFSFRSIKLAMLSFIPMAISWVWILGIMSMLDIKFNIVNIILATFIFGQGDDYTIFMTEGCIYERKYNKPILASYKNSIILSALIMFVGIGTLIFAKHPAMHSLAEITIIGMFSVVLMAYIVPPLLYGFIQVSQDRQSHTCRKREK